MSWIAEMARRARTLWRRREMEDRLAEEMEFHMEMKRREHAESGMPEQAAEAAARRDVGRLSRVVEDSREVWGLVRVEALWQDVRYAVRTLGRSPGFLLAAVVGGGLAIGAVAAVFSVVDATLLRPLPYREPERLVMVWDQLRTLGLMRFPAPVANLLDYRHDGAFERVEAWTPASVTLQLGDRAERLPVARATAGLAAMLGVRASYGRWFLEAENTPGRGGVAVLSDAAWRRWFGADPAIVGRPVTIDEEPHEVVGVLPASFRFLPAGADAPQIWLPLVLVDDGTRHRAELHLIARLAGGVTVEQAGARMWDLAARLKRDHRMGMGPNGEDGGFAISVTAMREELYGAVRPALYAIGGATIVLLLMGCCNTAFLWLTRVSARRREMQVREALGARMGRLVQHRAVEGLVVAVGSGAVGVALAWLAVNALRLEPMAGIALEAVRLDWRVLLFTTLVAGAVGVACSTLPVWRARREARSWSGWSDRSGTAGAGESRMRSTLIVAQAALTCSLLVAALLLGRSFVKLMAVDPGYHAAGLVTARVSLPPRYREPAQVAGYFRRLLEELEARMGAGAATLTSQLPLSFGGGGDPFSIEGRPYRANGPVPQASHTQAVGPRYHELLGIPLVEGRLFEERDFAGEGAVAIVSRRLAEGFWPGASALGHRVVMGAPRPGARWATIVGVVGDVRTESLTREAAPQIYLPYPRSPGRGMSLVARGGATAIEELRRAVSAVDPGTALFGAATMEERMAGAVAGPRFRLLLFTGYGALAFALAVFGVYSLMSYSVSCRTREFAVRMAVGATGRGVAGMLAGQALRLVAAGAACGLAIAAGFSGAMGALLFGVPAIDGWSYGVAALVVAGVCTAAALVPAWRATRVAPARVLLGE